jgi:hypothetical protein
MDYIIWEYEGFKIRQRPSDKYYSAKDICAVGGKQFGHWNKREEKEPYGRNKILRKLKLPLEEVVQIRAYHNAKHYPDSWVHPVMAQRLANWVSPALEDAVEGWNNYYDRLEADIKNTNLSEWELIEDTVQTVDDVELSLNLRDMSTVSDDIENSLDRLDAVISCLNICKEKNEKELYQNLVGYLQKLIFQMGDRKEVAKVELLKNGQYSFKI